MPRGQYYLGFDCATKTFAYSLSWVQFDRTAIAQWRRRAEMIRETLARAESTMKPGAESVVQALVDRTRTAAEALDAEVLGSLRIFAGATVDLFPGRADGSISAVERIRAMSVYVRAEILPRIQALGLLQQGGAAADSPPQLSVLVEFQMGANAPARMIAAGLVALFADYDLVVVPPSLKNKIATCAEGHYAVFAQQVATSYTANKNHAKFNFGVIEKAFGTGIPPSSAALRGHIADSFMQVIGWLVHGAAAPKSLPGAEL